MRLSWRSISAGSIRYSRSACVHVKEIAEDHGGGRAPQGALQRQVVIGVSPALADEVRQPRILDGQGVDPPAELIDQRELRVLIRLRERDVEADHPGPRARQVVHQRGDLGPRPRPAPLRVEALLVDHRQDHGRRGSELAARDQAEVVGLELDEIEDRDAGRGRGRPRAGSSPAVSGRGIQPAHRPQRNPHREQLKGGSPLLGRTSRADAVEGFGLTLRGPLRGGARPVHGRPGPSRRRRCTDGVRLPVDRGLLRLGVVRGARSRPARDLLEVLNPLGRLPVPQVDDELLVRQRRRCKSLPRARRSGVTDTMFPATSKFRWHMHAPAAHSTSCCTSCGLNGSTSIWTPGPAIRHDSSAPDKLRMRTVVVPGHGGSDDEHVRLEGRHGRRRSGEPHRVLASRPLQELRRRFPGPWERSRWREGRTRGAAGAVHVLVHGDREDRLVDPCVRWLRLDQVAVVHALPAWDYWGSSP